MNQIRFHIYDGDHLVHQSEWVPESTRTCAMDALAMVRRQLGNDYSYRIERAGDSKVPNKIPMYRYRIKTGEVLAYSKLFTEAEKDEGLAQIKEMYPKASIEETII